MAAALSALTLAWAAGCSSDSTGTTSTSGDSGSSSSGSSASSGSSGSSSSSGGGDPVECNPTKSPGATLNVTVTSVEATVLDDKDAPVPNSLIQLCGINLCLNDQTGPDGHVVVMGGDKMLTNPAFKYGDGFLYGKFGVPIKDAVTMLGTIATAKLPAGGDLLEPGKSVTSGGVTLAIPAGAGVEVDELIYDTTDKQGFKAAAVPLTKNIPALDASLNLEMLFAVAPVDTIFCPAVGVTVDNTEGWAAGTAVEFFIHGVGIEEFYVPYGGWAKISDGVVSADGMTISTTEGQGLPILTAFGIRQKK